MSAVSRSSVGPAIAVVAAWAAFALAPTVPAADEKQPAHGVALQTEKLAGGHAELAKRIDAAATGVMKSAGLAGAMGGVHVKVMYPWPQEVILPIPQLTGGQVPVSLFVRCSPHDSVAEYRLWDRGDGNVVLRIRLVGKPQDVRIERSSVVLLATNSEAPNETPPEAFRSATGCVQSRSVEVKKLAADLWPKTGSPRTSSGTSAR